MSHQIGRIRGMVRKDMSAYAKGRVLVSQPLFGPVTGRFYIGPMEDDREMISTSGDHRSSITLVGGEAVVSVSDYMSEDRSHGQGCLYKVRQESSGWKISEVVQNTWRR